MEDGDALLLSLSLNDGKNGNGEGGQAPELVRAVAPAAPQETPREARIRKALEDAQRNYRAQIDDDAWYFADDLSKLLSDTTAHEEALTRAVHDALRTQSRSGMHLEWTVSHLYTTEDYASAFRLCRACLEAEGRTFERPSEAGGATPQGAAEGRRLITAARSLSGAPKKKGKQSGLKSVAPTKEMMDVALRSLRHLIREGRHGSLGKDWRSYAEWLIAASIKEAWSPVTDFTNEQCASLVSSQQWQAASSKVNVR